MAKKKKVDRRLLRTRTLLQEALLAMILRKGYEATTVQDIIDQANVGRSTFYAHFGDKESLLLSRLEDLRDFLRQEQAATRERLGRTAQRRFAFSLAMLEHAKDHWQLYQAMVGKKSGHVVLQRIKVILVDLAGEELAALGYQGTPAERALAAQYVEGGFMGVVTWWLEHGAKLSAQEVDTLFHRLVMQGLESRLA